MNDKKCKPLPLPQKVKDVVTLRNPLVAWTKLDPDLENVVDDYFCCAMFGTFVVCPCMWPFLLILFPCILSSKMSATNDVMNTKSADGNSNTALPDIKFEEETHDFDRITQGEKVGTFQVGNWFDCVSTKLHLFRANYFCLTDNNP